VSCFFWLTVYILTKSVSVEAIGCEQLAQSRYAAAPWAGIELATSWSQVRRPTVAPPRHLRKIIYVGRIIAECVMHRSAVCPSVRLSVTTLTHPAYVFVPLSGSRYTPYRIVAMGAGTCLYANIYVYTKYKQRYNMIHVIIGETRLFPCCIRPRNCSLLLAVNIT